MVLIGVSPCYMYENTSRLIFNGRPILYLEESMAHFILRYGACPILIPTDPGHDYSKWIDRIDGLILQGGVDVSPQNYGETPIKDTWKGDPKRDLYELRLVEACLKQGKPILGICRGNQVLNVFFGGSLFQDITHLVPGSLVHRDQDLYETNHHGIRFAEGGLLQGLYPGLSQVMVNSVHHQAVKDLGKGLRVEAWSTADGVIEGISAQEGSFCMGLQWHPEFQDPADATLLNPSKIMETFLIQCKGTKDV